MRSSAEPLAVAVGVAALPEQDRAGLEAGTEVDARLADALEGAVEGGGTVPEAVAEHA